MPHGDSQGGMLMAICRADTFFLPISKTEWIIPGFPRTRRGMYGHIYSRVAAGCRLKAQKES